MEKLPLLFCGCSESLSGCVARVGGHGLGRRWPEPLVGCRRRAYVHRRRADGRICRRLDLPQGTGQLIETLYGWTGFGPPWGGNGSAGRFKVRYLNWLWVGLRAVLPNPLPNLVPDGASKSPAPTRQAPCVERHPLAHIAPNASLRPGSPGVIAVAGLGLGAGYLGCLAHWSGLREGAQEGPQESRS